MNVISKVHWQCVGARAVSDSEYGPGSGPIVLRNVACTGYESRLLQCEFEDMDLGSCSHNDDAGVECMAGKKILIML